MTRDLIEKTGRLGKIERITGETRIELSLDLEGTGHSKVETGLPFLDHMLELFAKHGLFDLAVDAQGDLQVDAHHTVEDIGLTLGSAIRKALGDKEGIRRYGFFLLPMDEVLAEVALDLSGRPYLAYRVDVPYERIGNFDSSLLLDFFQGLVGEAGMTLHISARGGNNPHHIIEAVFKGFARALDAATEIDRRVVGAPSTKGLL